MMDNNAPRLQDVVKTRYSFTGFVQLNRALEPDYRRACRKAFLPTETENQVFRQIVRAARGNLDQGRRNLMVVSPFGTGKTLLLVMAHDIFNSKGNKEAISGFDQAVQNDLAALTSQGPYLVVPVVGTESPMPLSQAILGAFRQAVQFHPFLKEAQAEGTFLVEIEYEQAVSWLRKISDGQLGHLRSPLEKFLQDHPTLYTLSSLERALEDCDPTALETWRESFQNITGQPASALGLATPRDVFDRALPLLQKQGIVGISLLIDEFSQYLRLYPQYEADAFRTLDPLIHWINDSDKCFSIVATQFIPEQPQQADYQTWASIRGRFHIYHMDRQRYDQLIAQALERAPNSPFDPDKHPQMDELCQSHIACFAARGDDRIAAQRAVARYYPFHPTVISAISTIADTLGQYERSIFQYLDRTTEEGFKDFIANHPAYFGQSNERLTLVTLDEIFRFFARDWSKLEGVNDSLAQAWRSAATAIGNDELSQRILNLLTLLAFIDGRAVLPTPDIQGIAQMLNLPVDQHLQDVLNNLTESEYFIYDGAQGYRLLTGSGPKRSEVNNAIQRKLASDVGAVSSTDVHGYLKKYQELSSSLSTNRTLAPRFPIELGYDTVVKKIKKPFTTEFVTWGELVRYGSGDSLAGKLLVGVVTIADNAGQNPYSDAVKAAKRLAEAGAIVALPRHPIDAFTKPVKEYRAAKAVADDPRLGSSESAKLKLEEALFRLLTVVSNQYEISKLVWYTPNDPTTGVSFNDAPAAIDVSAQKLTEKFPSCIAKPDLIGGDSLSAVIEVLLGGGGLIELRGKPGLVYSDALEPLGIVAIGSRLRNNPQQEVKLAQPDPHKPEQAASAEIWGRIVKALPRGPVVTGEALHNALQELRRPPYWCPENLIVYLLAAYLGKFGGEVRDPRDASFHKPSVDDIKALGRGRSTLEVRIPLSHALNSDQTHFIESLAKAVRESLPAGAAAYAAGTLDSKAPESALAKVGEDLGRWYREYGAWADELISTYQLSVADADKSAFLREVATACQSGQNHLQIATLYANRLPGALQASPHQAPLAVEQAIEALTGLANLRAQIKLANQLRASDESLQAIWDKFINDCLNRGCQEELLRAITEAEAHRTSTLPKLHSESLSGQAEPTSVVTHTETEQETLTSLASEGSITSTNPGTPTSPAKPPLYPTSDFPTAGTLMRPLSAEEIESFASFVFAIVSQVRSGEQSFKSLEEIVRAYRTQAAGVLSRAKGELV